MAPKERKIVKKIKIRRIEGVVQEVLETVEDEKSSSQEETVRGKRGSSGPEEEASTITDEDLAGLRVRYGIPDDIVLRRPTPLERVVSAPSGFVAVYEDALAAGLRFLIHSFIIGLLNEYNIAFTQFTPNGFRNIIGFMLHSYRCMAGYHAPIFQALFTLKPHPYDKGWYYFSPRRGRKILHGLPTAVHGWKNRFFFIPQSPEMKGYWGTPILGFSDEVPPRFVGAYNEIIMGVAPTFSELVTDEELYNAGIRQVGRRFIVCFRSNLLLLADVGLLSELTVFDVSFQL